MSHVLGTKRQWVFLLPLCLHGLALSIGALVWLVFALGRLLDPTASDRHLFRDPEVVETAGGRTWFVGTSEALVAASPVDGVAPWRPRTGPVGLTATTDPWGGCSVRQQHYTSGKNAAWHDDMAWSYGGYVLRDSRGKSVVVPLSFLASPSRVEMTLEEVRELLPDRDQPHAIRYMRECFPATASVSVDGFVDAEGKLLRGTAEDPVGARIETPAERLARARRGVSFECVGLVAGLVPLVWLAGWICFIRRPFALRAAVATIRPGDGKKTVLRGLAVGGTLALVGVVAVATGRVAPAMLIASFLAGGVVASWYAYFWTVSDGVAAFRAALVGTSKEWKSAEGVVVRSDGAPLAEGTVTGREHSFVRVEVLGLTAKGAVGPRILQKPSHARLEARLEEGRIFVDTTAAEIFGPSEEVRLDAAAVRAKGIEGPWLAESRYVVRETYVDEGAVVTVVGETTTEADPLARGEDYREAGRSAVYVAKDGKGPLVFAHPRSALLAQAEKDKVTLFFPRAVATLFVIGLVAAPALAIALGR